MECNKGWCMLIMTYNYIRIKITFVTTMIMNDMITILVANAHVWIFIKQQEKHKQHDQLVLRCQKFFIALGILDQI